MRGLLPLHITLFVLGLTLSASGQIYLDSTILRTEVVADDLHAPWEILWGPDDWIWFTERNGKVGRVNPETGEIDELLQLTDLYMYQVSGLFGMALHPNFADTAQLFLVYTYLDKEKPKEKLVRYTYRNGSLVDPLVLIGNIPAAQIRNGSRIIATPDRKIMMTTGDINQPELAQDLTSLNGKTLRVNFDGSVPKDNPIPGSYIWSWGHRNAQGLVLAENGIVYSSEHADKSDDEVNIIEKGGNYGWIDVQGFCDTPEERAFCEQTPIHEAIGAWTPSIAPCGLQYYNHDAIPEWKNSLLLATLKHDDIRVLKLSDDGRSIESEEIYFNDYFGRLRDVCVAPSGDIYIATSNQQDAKADGSFPVPTDDKIIRVSVANDPRYVSEKSIVKIFPNPFDTFTTIQLDSKYSTQNTELRFEVYDYLGQTIQEMSVSPEKVSQISKDNHKPGIYFYRLFDGNQMIDSGRFMIN